MPDAPKDGYQIVLEKVPDERQSDAALFLSGCFSLPPTSTRGIAASGPIALLTDMTRTQAETVLAELTASLPAGVELRLADSTVGAKVSRLQWPRPPRIYGRDLAEFARDPESHNLKCPLCGGMIRVFRDSGGGVGAAAASNTNVRHASSRRTSSSKDEDPLFSGIKPVAPGASDLASVRSIQAGDTGFWMDYSHNVFVPPAPEPPVGAKPGASSHGQKSTGKIAAGLSAFMKPGVFSVVVGRTKEPQAVKMISEIMGITQDAARDKSLNLSLCVARDISLDEAQNLVSRFKNLGARARIAKPI